MKQLVSTYSVEQLNHPNLLPEEGKSLYNQLENHPIWSGFYPKFVNYFKGEQNALTIRASLFEKIRQGEVWRLFTPALLHNGIFHLFFNMLWLLVIGKQMESKIKPFKYILFIIIVGIFSNVSQYMMSGPIFSGFSGVLCGMIVFIWFRNKKAPWEAYQLLPSTMGYITIFVLMMFILQVISFGAEVLYDKQSFIPIANTAHLTGALLGYLLSKLNFFAVKT